MTNKTALVTGAAGFIGHHLVRYLQKKGYWVVGADYKFPEFAAPTADHYDFACDIREYKPLHQIMVTLREAGIQIDEVYALAADMGGMGYIGTKGYEIYRNNMLINIHTAEIARRFRIPRLFFSSSACIYPEFLQMDGAWGLQLPEQYAWQGAPDTWYGKEKLAAEELYLSLAEDIGTTVRIARFHNIMGPEGSWNDGREKLPAAACRKVAQAKLRPVADLGIRPSAHSIEVWGDGQATRSFCYIDDCLEMIYRLMQSGYGKPMNIGTDREVSVNEVFLTVADIAEVQVDLQHDLTKPQGVRHRNADLETMRRMLDYEPQVSLEDGLQKTYEWVAQQIVMERLRREAAKEMASA